MQARLFGGLREPDRPLLNVQNWFLGHEDFAGRFARAVRSALDDAVNPFGTGRASVRELSKPEKTIVGMLVERAIREEFDLVHGALLDYVIAGNEVDCKFSLYPRGWMIPREAVGQLCLIVWADDETRLLRVGLVRAVPEALTVGANQDKKRSICKAGMNAVTWLIDDNVLPANRFLQLSSHERELILDATEAERRALELFMRCEGAAIPMTDVARTLSEIGFVLLDGNRPEDRDLAVQLGGPCPEPGEWLCLGTPPRRSA